MKINEIKIRFPQASASFIAANIEVHHSRQVAKLESNPCDAPLAAHQGKAETATKFLVRFVSFRKRLCDPDNVSVKWTLDALRYARILRGDEPDKITLEVSQIKVAFANEERTEIEITQL